MTYAMMPDDVFTKVSIPGFLGSAGNFYYFDMSQEDLFYWFGRAGFMGDLNTGDGTWWNAYGPASDWPASCYRNDAFDKDGNPNGCQSCRYV